MNNLKFEQHFKELGFASQRRYPNEALIQFLAAHYFHVPKDERSSVRILELGCGSGANLWMVAKEGFSAYGIDIAPTGIQFCKEQGVEANVSVGDISKQKQFDRTEASSIPGFTSAPAPSSA